MATPIINGSDPSATENDAALQAQAKTSTNAEFRDTRDFLKRIEVVAGHWEGVIDSLLESHRCAANVYPEPIPPLPEWAVKRLKQYGEVEAREFRQNVRHLSEALRLAAGAGSSYRFEIWNPKGEPGYHDRLDPGADTLQDARAILDLHKAEFPKAFIAKIHVTNRGASPGSAELLDTMIPPLRWAGTVFGEEIGDYDLIEVMDRTGRTVLADAKMLQEHPVFSRFSPELKEQVEFSVKHTIQTAERVAANAREFAVVNAL